MAGREMCGLELYFQENALFTSGSLGALCGAARWPGRARPGPPAGCWGRALLAYVHS